MLKKYKNFFIVVLIIVVVLVGIRIIGNHYSFESRDIQFESNQGTIEGILTTPKDNNGNLPLLVFVNGDGPTKMTNAGQYEPLMEKMADKGYACLSWNKPGVKKTEGDWQTQSMDDRADEVIDAIKFAKKQPEINGDKIGLIGFQQAGWVLPKVSKKTKEIDYNILVAPSNNWIEDTKYSLAVRSDKAKDSKKEKEKLLKDFDESAALFAANDNYEDYKKAAGKERALPEVRWTYKYLNFKEDVSDQLVNYYSPVKLIVGDKDASVDSKNTLKIYKKGVSEDLLDTTFIEDTDHYMTTPELVKSEIRTSFVATLWPRKLLAEEYYDAIDKFIDKVK
ncbi:MAG: alpha/beta hydrolase [Anaerovoracaceae bacterium]